VLPANDAARALGNPGSMKAAIAKWTAMALVASISGLGAAAALGAGRAPDDGAGNREAARFAARAIRLLAENRYGAAWESLLPEHQRVAPRAEYVACERTSLIPGRVIALRVSKVVDELFTVPGVDGATPTKAVSIRIEIVDDLVPEGVVVEHVVHVVPVDDGWAWVLPASRYDAYRDAACVR
jgi:hypothetical protein